MSPELRETLRQRVERGASELDRVEPDWYNKVPVNELNISSCFYCIMGHVFGEYTFGVFKVAKLNAELEAGESWAINHGFLASFEVDDEGHGHATSGPLEELWKQQIAARKWADMFAELASVKEPVEA